MSSGLPSELTAASRDASIRYELLDVHDQMLGKIDGVTGGNLDWSAGKSVKVGGTIDIDDVQGIDWVRSRIRITRTVNGYTWRRGIYVPAAPKRKWKHGRWTYSVEILGKLTLLDQDIRGVWTGIQAGTNGVAKVKALLAGAGHTRVSIPDSDTELRTALVFDPKISLLGVVNVILDAVGYWALSSDGEGVFTSSPYILPADRVPRYEWLDDAEGIVVDEFDVDEDIYSIPNRVIVEGVATEDQPALFGTAENLDPSSPYSIPARGLVVPWSPEAQSSAATQALIDAEAERWLVEKSSVTASVPLSHAPVPVDLNDVVRWRRQPAGINSRWSVQAINEPLDEHEDMTSQLREVVRL